MKAQFFGGPWHGVVQSIISDVYIVPNKGRRDYYTLKRKPNGVYYYEYAGPVLSDGQPEVNEWGEVSP